LAEVGLEMSFDRRFVEAPGNFEKEERASINSRISLQLLAHFLAHLF
jgi:hypothetical protein